VAKSPKKQFQSLPQKKTKRLQKLKKMLTIWWFICISKNKKLRRQNNFNSKIHSKISWKPKMRP
jgi:hypothetical protein